MASTKREKELARQRAARQAARQAEAARRRRQRGAVIATVVAVLLVVGAVVGSTLLRGGDTPSTDVAAGPSAPPVGSASAESSGAPSGSPPAASASAQTAGGVSCTFTPTPDRPSTRKVELPPAQDPDTTNAYDVTVSTNQGDVVFRMDSAKTPCAATNLRSLAHFRYYDDTPCHRLTTQGILVLQCGDPTGTGAGGPGYTFADEALNGATYPAGTVAMANAGPNTNGSQFFLVYGDSKLDPLYTPVGRITEGLDVLQKIAKAGTQGGSPDGKPALPVQIQTLRAKRV